MRPSRVSLLLLLAALAALGAGTASAAHNRTAATVFEAFNADGTPTIQTTQATGSCYSGSLTINRSDAWRCSVGNDLYDPCFSSNAAPGVVVCPTNSQLTRGITINLSSPLSTQYADSGSPTTRDQPWLIELYDGSRCWLASGASNVVHGVRLNYFCGSSAKWGLWGYPSRRTEPWTILKAPFTAKSLSHRVAVEHAWM